MIVMAQDTLHHLLLNYGSFALFGILAFGIIGLPVPDETLLLATGYMAAKGDMSLPLSLLGGILGSIIGITVSYFIGRFVGTKTILYFGKYVGMTEAKLEKAHNWFEKFGKYLLIIGYFIPGVRHFTGISAGVTRLEYPVFALFSYTGAVLWCTLFILLGYFFFNQWHQWAF